MCVCVCLLSLHRAPLIDVASECIWFWYTHTQSLDASNFILAIDLTFVITLSFCCVILWVTDTHKQSLDAFILAIDLTFAITLSFCCVILWVTDVHFVSEKNWTMSSSTQETSEENFSQSSDSSADTPVHYKFVPGWRQGSTLLYVPAEHQLYAFNGKLKNGKMSYRCNNTSCRVRVVLNNDACYSTGATHPHGSSEATIVNLMALNEVKKDILANRKAALRDVFNDVMAR